MVPVPIAGNILGEATTSSGNIFNDAMRGLGWVNERNLRDFFGILASRNNADEGRLAFWSNYLEQITWTR